MAHKTELRVILKKICRQKLRSEERITCAKFQKNGDKKVQKFESGFLEQGCVFLKVDLKQPEFLEFMKNFRF